MEKWAVRVKRPRQKHMVSTREGDVGRGSLDAASTTDTPTRPNGVGDLQITHTLNAMTTPHCQTSPQLALRGRAHQSIENRGTQSNRVIVRESPALATPGRPHCFNNIGCRHDGLMC